MDGLAAEGLKARGGTELKAAREGRGDGLGGFRARLDGVSLWVVFAVLAVAVFASHWTLLRLPYFWDEAGYYIPAAWDFFRTGTLIPVTTMTNAHPPLPSVLLAGWWGAFGFTPYATRTLVCVVAAGALTGVFRLARGLAGGTVALTVTLLTGVYPIWFAQSTLAHADIFAAAFMLWGLSCYFLRPGSFSEARVAVFRDRIDAAALLSLAALCKETAIVTPVALAALEVGLAARRWFAGDSENRTLRVKRHAAWALALMVPVLPLVGWYGYHFHRTGFVFGNPEYLRYNATANLSPVRVAVSLWHRMLHLTVHMNLWVATGCTVAALLMPGMPGRARLPRAVMGAIVVVAGANWVEYSVLGGALLTRYLLPVYPLVLLVCVVEWRLRLKHWVGLAGLTAAAFAVGIVVNPPYGFAPEDNLTYRDMVVLHQRAAGFLGARYPASTVLTAWPATRELERPELGYVTVPMRTVAVKDFSLGAMQQAAADPGLYDTALVFSTKWEPRAGRVNLGEAAESNNRRFFDFHRDLRPSEAARVLAGEVVWEGERNGEWAAVLHFPRSVDARLEAR